MNRKTIFSSGLTFVRLRVLPIFLVAAVVFWGAAATPKLWAGHHDGEEIPFDVAVIFFELNNTDGDLGIHALIDGDAWSKLKIEDPYERTILSIKVKGNLQNQGLTELFFESAEPTFDELSPEEFFNRFPEGIYEIEGLTLERDKLESEVELTHLMPAPAGNVRVSGIAAAENCDVEPLPVVSQPVIISWDPVTGSHPYLGRTGEAIEVDRYQVVVEQEELGLDFSVNLPPYVTELEIPAGFIALGEEFKFEILVREESGNQTAIESCFVVE